MSGDRIDRADRRALRGGEQAERPRARRDVGDARLRRERRQPQRLARERLEVGERFGRVVDGDQIPRLGGGEDAHAPKPYPAGWVGDHERRLAIRRASPRPGRSRVQVVHDVQAGVLLLQLGLVEDLARPRQRARDDHVVLAPSCTPEIAFSSATSPVASMAGTLAEVDDEHLERVLLWSAERRHRLLRRAEEERAVDLVDAPTPLGTLRRAAHLLGGVTLRDSVSSAMRRMNSSAASTTPTETATTMSNTTVRRKQVTARARRSRRDAHDVTKCCTSAMFQATKTSSAASAAIGM